MKTQKEIMKVHEEAGYSGRPRTPLEIKEFDEFLLHPEFAGYRNHGGNYQLLRYDRPSSLHGGPTGVDSPNLCEGYFSLLENIAHLIPAA